VLSSTLDTRGSRVYLFMANPQKENGNTQIANELYGALAQADLTSTEYKIILTVIRKTYGFNKKEDRISLSQFVEYTKISRSMICRAINKLVNRSILVKPNTPPKGQINTYRLNKDYNQWVVKQSILVNQIDLSSEPRDNRVVNLAGHTKDNIQNTNKRGEKFLWICESNNKHPMSQSGCDCKWINLTYQK